jgi:hypothetical protein
LVTTQRPIFSYNAINEIDCCTGGALFEFLHPTFKEQLLLQKRYPQIYIYDNWRKYTLLTNRTCDENKFYAPHVRHNGPALSCGADNFQIAENETSSR